MKKYNFCNNCGKTGHLFHQCNHSIISSGIIVFRNGQKGIEFLLICRKDSLGYVDFLRGKYPLHNKLYIQNLIDEMTNYEKKNLLEKEFNELWNDLWGGRIALQYRSEENISGDKFNKLKKGVMLKNKQMYNLKQLMEGSTTRWDTPEWGFPKGRRNYQENDIHCAIREFEEETGLKKKDLKIIRNIIPYEEIFLGSNYKSYKHKYFMAYMNHSDCNFLDNYQKSEVSQIKWLGFDECLKIIRPYNLEKKRIIQQINKLVHSCRLIL